MSELLKPQVEGMEARATPEPFMAFFETLQRAMAAREFSTAQSILDSAEPGWRNRLPARRLEARLLLMQGRLPEAEAACRAILETRPDDVSVTALLCRVLAAAGRADEARDLFERHLWTSELTPEQKAGILADLTNAGGAGEIEAFVRRLEATRPLGPGESGRLAISEARLGLPERALERLMGVERANDLSQVQTSQLMQLLVQEFRLDEARARAAALTEREPTNPEWLLRLAQIEFLEGNISAAADRLAAALALAPGTPALLRALVGMPMSPDRFRDIFRQVEAARDHVEFTEVANWSFALAALQAREPEAAIKALETIGPGSDEFHANAQLMLSVLRSRPLEDWIARPRLADDPTRAARIVCRDGAAATLIVFPGLHNQFGNLPYGYLDVLLSELPANIVYLRDLGQTAFLDGTRGLGESEPAMADSLKRMAGELAAPRIVTLGSSIGGFAAIRYGARLGAAAAVSFSGPSKLYSTDDRPDRSKRRVGLAFMRRYSERQRDVLPDVRANPDMTVWHFAGAENVEDIGQQNRLLGLPQARLETVPGVASHNTVLPTIAAGRLLAIVARAVGGDA
ncbi:tetratricopeptide repeat protein [Propylenella binzhouense]|uniref:Tetratricopeptide repeat protein n=1 Tax=Propylenella binzhouense TaxID=2555902 RepID=A0A964WS72_9HYPH|nr:tetratricopeptide repeat protein [Propylenella binzhouense]MYZ46566.1 tetratricopeptide repeat protein [Propylenella binzhouense]